MRPMLPLLLLSTAAHAGELELETVARIQHDQKKAMADIDKAHGHKKPSQMSSAERRQVIREQAEAERKVLEKHGVDAKDYARRTARLSPQQKAQVEAMIADLERKEEEAKKAGQKRDEGIKIQRGFSDDNPVELEATEDAQPVVEHGIPVDER